MVDLTLLAALCAFIAVLLATYVVVDFFLYLSRRYRDRFLEEATLELDDILLQMPAGRVLDFSLGLAIGGAFLAGAAIGAWLDEFAWQPPLIVALLVGFLCFPVPRLILRTMRKRRLIRFNEQLEDALTAMSSSLKAGFSILQALEEVAAGRKHPISIEFRLLVQEIQLGVPLEQALENMNRRLGSEDLELVTLSIVTARQTGGELPACLDRLAAMIRERLRIQGKMRALTAMGRLQSLVISVMPFILLVGLLYVMPGSGHLFFGTAFGLFGLGLVCVLVLIGFLVTRKITTIDI